MKKGLIASLSILTAVVIMGGVVTISHADTISDIKSNGRIEFNDVVFDASDFKVLETTITQGKQDAYEQGKQEILDNLYTYVGEYMNSKNASLQAFNVGTGKTVVPEDGFYIYKWFFRDCTTTSGATHHVNVTWYDTDGNVKAVLIDETYNHSFIERTPALICVKQGDYFIGTDSSGELLGFYTFGTSEGCLMTFDK